MAVHRLDRDTSGCLLLARNPKAQRAVRSRRSRRARSRRPIWRCSTACRGRGRDDRPGARQDRARAEAGWRMVARPEGQGGADRLAGAARRGTAARWSSSARRPGGRTRSASMPRPGWARRWSAIRSTGGRTRAACCSTPRGWSCRAAGKPPIEAEAPLPERFGALGRDDRRCPRTRSRRSFLAATGPGGQNVNKVATACQLRVDVFRAGAAPGDATGG